MDAVNVRIKAQFHSKKHRPPGTRRHHSVPVLNSQWHILEFSCLKHAASIIAIAAGCGTRRGTGHAYFCRHHLLHSTPPPHYLGPRGAEFYTRSVPYVCLHNVSPAACVCLRVLHTAYCLLDDSDSSTENFVHISALRSRHRR